MYFKILKEKDNKYYFTLSSDDDKILLNSSEWYESEYLTKNEIKILQNNLSEKDNYELFKTQDENNIEKYYFIVKDSAWNNMWVSVLYNSELMLDSSMLLLQFEWAESEIL